MGHLIRHKPFIINIMEERINGHKLRERQMSGEMIEIAGCNGYSHMKILALKREE